MVISEVCQRNLSDEIFFVLSESFPKAGWPTSHLPEGAGISSSVFALSKTSTYVTKYIGIFCKPSKFLPSKLLSKKFEGRICGHMILVFQTQVLY